MVIAEDAEGGAEGAYRTEGRGMRGALRGVVCIVKLVNFVYNCILKAGVRGLHG